MKMYCDHKDYFYVDSRKMQGYTRRRVECKDCHLRWSTVEIPVDRDFDDMFRILRKISADSVLKRLAYVYFRGHLEILRAAFNTAQYDVNNTINRILKDIDKPVKRRGTKKRKKS